MIILWCLGASSTCLLAALSHDAAELATGDIPATTKWAHLGLGIELSSIEGKWERSHGIEIGHSLEEAKLLKTADMLELCFFARDQLMLGNKNAQRLLLRGILFIRGLYPDGMPERVQILVNHVQIPPYIED
jgi:5'-deoxynucleotidase YfbR-like HD superfamily hydrolase